MKIAILGFSGSGKSTVAKYLSERYNVPVLYLDTVQFLPNWKQRDRDEAVSIVKEFMEKDAWVIDGNYTAFLQADRLQQADSIIYMNFSRLSCLLRAFKRYFKYRNTSRESAADGCIEKIDAEFVWWILYESRTKQRKSHYRKVIEMYKQKTIIIRNQKQLNQLYKKENVHKT